jgi:hypothetical protein
VWSKPIELGVLRQGTHVIHVAATLYDSIPGAPASTHHVDVSFVVFAPTPPPPPPGPPPLVQLVRTIPEAANNVEPTTMVLGGSLPYPCGIVTDAQVIDADHVALSWRRGPPCADTLGIWEHAFELGVLHGGWHSVTVAATIYDSLPGMPPITRNWTVGFSVSGNDTVPPGPPPQTTLAWSATSPTPANDTDPTTLSLGGWFPWDCGQVTGVHVIDGGHVALTLRPADPSCASPSRAWSQAFALGVLQQGWHDVQVDLTLTDSIPGYGSRLRQYHVGFEVKDGASVPLDSLVILDGTRPNPFRERTRFSIQIERPSRVRVSIFDLAGREVQSLYAGLMNPGKWVFQWDGTRKDGSRAPGGVYFYGVATSRGTLAKRVVLVPHE